MRTLTAFAAASALLVALTGCSGPDDVPPPAAKAAANAAPVAVQTWHGGAFGPACATFAERGTGSIADLADERIGTAVARSRGLSTFTSVLRKLDAVRTFDNIENVTLFAPTDEAFAKLSADQRTALLDDPERLGKLVSAHVAGPKATSNRFSRVTLRNFLLDRIRVTGSGKRLTVNKKAAIVCGDVKTAKGTIHLIDTLLAVP